MSAPQLAWRFALAKVNQPDVLNLHVEFLRVCTHTYQGRAVEIRRYREHHTAAAAVIPLCLELCPYKCRLALGSHKTQAG